MPAQPTLLCIDDEITGLMIRKLVLEMAGYRVLTAASGAEALRVFETSCVDGVVVDFYMPDMDGGQVACRLRKLKPDIPIVMLSAFVDVPQQALAAVDAYITKGQPPTVLLDHVRALLKNRNTGVDAHDPNWCSAD